MTSNALFYQAGAELPLISHAQGIYMWDTLGKRYIDGCSGAITCSLGHQHPAVTAAMKAQLDQVAFSYRTQFESQVAIDLGDALVALTEAQLHKVFFVGSGSEAVESAMKLARQYFYDRGEPQRQRFVSLRPSYHGSTLGALGLTGYEPLERPYEDLITPSVKVPSPDFYRFKEADIETHVEAVLSQTEAAMAAQPEDSIVAFVLEPVGGASTGARMLNKRYVEGIRTLCDRFGCLLIMDEVLSGLGRTGEWFAWQHWGVCPDILVLAKGMGAGYYPVAGILAKGDLVDQVQNQGGFMHGHTYAGNPLACTTGLAVIRAMQNEGILDNVRELGIYLRQQLDQLKARYDFIGDVRGIGFLQGVELVQSQGSKAPFPAEFNAFSKITAIAREKGLLIYPRRCLNGVEGDHFLVTPPLNTTRAEIDEMMTLLDQALAEFSRILP
ncbi:aminotransferase family protein [Nitrincola iocasae]|uniref:Aspartate aminotransferase family protein n=1 Tax=Nitrincola iocasae TaxID=2614693 RepID=A0A5J6LGE5_9GAMM|nr:aspartate aminotransferase family protein [Nitrincola iocasae]QEW07271.1 aspartate aminotransferase family protein [Nitrincola iocasae]